MAMTASGARYRHHSVEGFIAIYAAERREPLREVIDVMDVLTQISSTMGSRRFGEQLLFSAMGLLPLRYQ